METQRQKFATWSIGRQTIGLIIALVLLLLYAGAALAAPVTVNDDKGPDDLPGQKDLNFLTVDYTPNVNDITVSWGWDDTMWSGANTGDACTLFDTDGDGFANYSMCITVEDAGEYVARSLFICTADSRSDRCGGPSEDFTFLSTGTASVQAVDPFGISGRGSNSCDANSNCLTNDTVGTLSIDKDDVGGGVAKLINVCSYPSREPNSDPSDCIFTPGSGFLTIVKVASPDDGTAFVFNASANSQGGANSWTINGSGTKPLISFAPGTTYDLSEAVPSGWDLDSAACVIQSIPTASTGAFSSANNRIDNFEIREGLETICTFTNLKPGKLIVNKVVVNDNGGTLTNSNFSFSVNGGAAVAFEADGQNDLIVDAGTYSVVEPAVNGYTASYDNCTNVAIPNGGTATCTITNTDNPPSLTLVKEVVNNNGGVATPDEWTLTATGPTGFSGVGPTVTNGASFDKGTYTLSESAGPGGYNASNWSCTGGTQSGNQITLELGESATCTIINDDVGAGLTLVKVVNNDNGGTASPDEWTLTATGPTGFSGVGPIVSNGAGFAVGTYTLSESGGVPGYTAGSWDCDGGTQDDNEITLAAGESATCTIINDDDAPSLTLVKEVNNNNGGNATAAEWTLVATGPSTFSDVGPTVNSDAGFDAGTYTLSEFGGPDGYTGGDWSCIGGTQSDDEITLALGESATCTITNDDDAPKLTLIKQVVNDNGGMATANSWTLNANGPTSFSAAGPEATSSDPDFSVGTYTLSETDGTVGYTAGSWSCVNGAQNDDEITLTFGEVVTCTITNNDQPALLVVQKVVTNDNGGTKDADDFTFAINGGTPITFEVDGENEISVNAGTYTVTEPEFAGYTTTYGSCEEIVLSNGETATCTIFNNDQPGTLIVEKTVINDDGGNQGVQDFSFQVNGDSAIFFNGLGSNELTVNAGTYTVTEPAVAGYTASYTNCEGVVIPNGGTATCSITNDDDPGTLIVKKIVINDNGGTKEVDDFTFQVNTDTPISFEADGENELTVDAGIYSVSEPAVEGYTTTYDTCSNQTVPNGGTVTCTITNDDQPGTLIVEKTVNNDNGGGKSADDFSFQINGESAIPFEIDGQNEVIVNAGTYTVTEPSVAGYAASYTNCEGVVIPNGGTATCSITNDDQAGTLIVEKTVINDNGGTKHADDFTFTINDGSAISFEADGENVLSVDAGTYTVTEPAVTGYTVSYSNCAGIVVPNGGSATCTVTNDDDAPSLTLVKVVTNDNGGTEVASSWILTASGPTPLTGPGPEVVSGPSFDTGTYTLTESTGPAGYTAGNWSCEGGSQAGNLITLGLGQSATCTIVNNDDAPSLTLVKEVINDNNGSADASEWTLVATGPTSLSGAGPEVNSNAAFEAGTYTLSEINGPDGYTASGWSCVGGDQADDEITIALSEIVTCTITNNDQAATLKVTKITTVPSNQAFSFEAVADGGLLSGGSFTLTNGTSKQFPVDAGTFTVTEEVTAGWELVSATCSDIAPVQPSSELTLTLGNGETRECIFTNDPLPEIQVTKTATTGVVIGTSGVVTFNVEVANTGLETVTLTSLADSDFDNLDGKGSCDLTPTVVLGPQEVYQCAFSGTVTGNEGNPHSNTVTAVAVDDEENETEDQDTETVIFDQLPAVEVTKSANVTEVVGVTGSVTFTIIVSNAGSVPFTITALSDSDFGNLNGKGTCVLGSVIPVGGSYTCAFPGTVTGNEATPHNNTVTVTVKDKDNNEDQDEDSETVPFDELPQVEVTKTANVNKVVGTSGSVTFTIVVLNVGSAPFTIITLTDSDFGNLNGKGTCATGAVIPFGGNYTCAFPGTVTGNEATPHNNTVTVTVKDKDNNEDQDQETETVPFDELPEIEVTKTANVAEMVGTSGPVTFTVAIRNIGNVAVTLTSLTDTDFGDLNGKGTCVTGGTIAVGGTYTCAFSGTITGNEATLHSNTVTATVQDTDGNEDEDQDTETVPFDELPLITVTKSANVTGVVGTSGPVQFTVTVENTSDVSVTLTSLTDSDFGDLNGQGNCATGGTIAAHSTYTCVFTKTITGNEATPHSNTVTATVEDKDGNEASNDDDAIVPFDELPSVEVTKSANVTETIGTSGVVTFTVVVQNIGKVTVTLDSLVDSDFGDLNGQGTCATGSVIPVGGSYTCTFPGTVNGSESLPHNNTVTVTVKDKENNEDQDEDSETVPFDELPQIEVTKTANVTEVVGTSGPVQFTVVVSNVGNVTVTLNSLVDSDFGNLNGKGTCVTGGVIAVGGSYTCVFTETVTGSESLPHSNTVTATVKDKDGNEDQDQDSETVPFDQLPVVEVTKSANVTKVVGTSGPVTFTVVVSNAGSVPFTITTLTDSDFGNLNGKGTCATDSVIPVGGSYTCVFSGTVTGNESLPHSNTVAIVVKDEDGNEDEDEDEEIVPFDELPSVEVTKSANVTETVGTSGQVEFTVVVENSSDVSVILTSLTDSDFGDLNGKGTCVTGGTIAVGDSYTCSFTETVTGSESLPHSNTITATVEDADGNEASDSDDETVTFDELPSVEVTKSANPTSVTGTSAVVTFTVTVQNIGNVPVTLDSLNDSDFGDLNGKGTCVIGGTIAVGTSYICAFSATITGSESLPHSNTVTVIVKDEDGNEDEEEDDETVPFDELPSVEVSKSTNVTEVVGTSGPVEFTIVVENIGNVAFTLTSLIDSDFGNLDGKGTCVTGGTIPVNGSYTCGFTETVTGSESTPHNNVVTAVVEDENGNEDSDEDDATVTFEGTPQVEVTKTANVSVITGTSGVVIFTITVQNIGTIPVTLTSLTDSDFGDLNGKGTCATGGVIAVGGSYTCTFTETVTGSESLPHNNTVTVVVKDEDGNESEDEDDETVPFDELPSVEVSKSANVTQVVGTSGPVEFTIVVKNIGNVAFTLTSLTDSDFGDLNGKGTCVTGGVIAVGASYTCAFTVTITGDEATPHSNTVTVIVEDTDGNTDSDEDDETVPFNELPNALGNRVWFDNDRNGIQDSGEEGVPGVKVDLYKLDNVALAAIETTDANGEELRTAASVFVATTTTDDNGEYLFTDLEAGSYYVEFATPAGYILTRYDVNGNSQDAVDSDALVPFLSLGVTDDGAEAEVEGNTIYSISYTNNDATRQATNVVITTTVPAGTSFVAEESSPEWSCTSVDEGGICTFTRATMAPNTSATLLFVFMLKDADAFPTAIDFAVYLTHTTPARTQTVVLEEGASNLTLDAGIVRSVGNESTPTPTAPTNLPGGEQPQQRMEMFLPSVSVDEAAAGSSVIEEETEEDVQVQPNQSTFLPSVESQE